MIRVEIFGATPKLASLHGEQKAVMVVVDFPISSGAGTGKFGRDHIALRNHSAKLYPHPVG